MLAVVALGSPAKAIELITPAEAALPPQQSIGHNRGISRGPTIIVVSPTPGAGMITSPLNLKVLFEGHGGATIDVNSVLLTYLRTPAVDLTQRVKADVGAKGIEVDNAEVPPGTHTIRVNVTDSEGHQSWADITFTVSK